MTFNEFFKGWGSKDYIRFVRNDFFCEKRFLIFNEFF